MKHIPPKDNEWIKHFHTQDIFQDKFISNVSGKYSIDIVKLDKYMHLHEGYDEEKDGSLNNFIFKKYGRDAVKFIEDNI